MKTRSVRLAALAIGLFVAAPAFASVTPLCDDHGKDKSGTKETEKKDKDVKKPANPA